MRVRRQGAAQSRQGVSDAASLRGARTHARACRPDRLPRSSEVLSAMTYVVRPASEKDVVEAVQQALRERKALELVGHGTKRALGRPAQADTTRDTSG